MTWSPMSSPVDYVLIGGQRTPGVASIEGASSPRDWDERRAHGSIGARLVYRGSGLARFTIRLRFSSDDEWQAWAEFAPAVNRLPDSQRPHALDVWHPFLEQLGITSCVVAEVLQPTPDDETGAWSVEIRCLEYREPVRRVVPAQGSQGEQHSEPRDEVDATIERLTSQLQSLAPGAA